MKKIVLMVIAAVLLLALGGGFLFWRYPLAAQVWMGRQELKKAGFVRNTLQTPAGTQVYWAAGSGPTLVFLHGAGDEGSAWSRVAPKFTGTHRVLVPDLAGHGDSQPAAGPLSIATVLASLTVLLDQQPADKPLVLVGNSMGAWLSMLYAHRHPERDLRVVAVNGGAIRGEGKGYNLTPANREEARKLVELIRDPASTKVPDFVLDDLVRTGKKGPLARLILTAPEMEKFVLDDHLGEIAAPVNIVWGRSDKLIPLSYAQKMEAALPAARLTEIPQCGHVPERECPSRLVGVLETALNQPPPIRKQPPIEVPQAK